jgi:hypothetical protein
VLARAASGECRVAVVHPRNAFVLDADRASHLVVCADDEIHLVECDAGFLVREPSIDALRRLFSVDASLSAGTRIASVCFGAGGRGPRPRARRALRGRQCLGLTERMVAIRVEYAKTRSQFGHRSVRTRRSSTISRRCRSARVRAPGRLRRRRARARPRCARSGGRVACEARRRRRRGARIANGDAGPRRDGILWEVDLHFYMKRAWALAGAWGDRNFHARRLQGLLFEDRVAIGRTARSSATRKTQRHEQREHR